MTSLVVALTGDGTAEWSDSQLIGGGAGIFAVGLVMLLASRNPNRSQAANFVLKLLGAVLGILGLLCIYQGVSS